MGDRRFWSVIVVSIFAMLILNALAGTAQSPVERMLHVTRVPVWLPLVFAGIFGIVLGIIFQKRQSGAGTAGAGGSGGAESAAPVGSRRAARDAGKPATRGRHAVPRHVRRERERQSRRASAQRDREERERQEAERLEKERQDAERAAARPAEDAGLRGRLPRLLRWRRPEAQGAGGATRTGSEGADPRSGAGGGS